MSHCPTDSVWWGDGGICCLVAYSSATVLGHAVLLWGSWWESCSKLAWITNQAPYVFHGIGQEKLKVKRENDSQTSNCVSGGNFQDFSYLMKILSLDSFPMWCQNGRGVNVWTVYWRLTLNSLWACVCVHVCLQLRFQHDCFYIKATLTSASRSLLWPIHIWVAANKQWHRLYSLVAPSVWQIGGTICRRWGQEVRKKQQRTRGCRVQWYKGSIKNAFILVLCT